MITFKSPFKGGKYPDIRADGPVNTAAFHGDIDTLKTLLETHGRHSLAFLPQGPQNWDALMVASFTGQVEVVRFLLDTAHFPLEQRDSKLRTPIHLATKSGSIAVVRLLLERGADPDRMDEAQRTALTYAAAAHNVTLLSCLLDGGADPDVTDQSLRSCLHYLAEGGHSHCGGGRGGTCGRAGEEAAAEAGVKLLLLYGAQVDIGDTSGHTPLHLAAASSSVGVVRLLLELGGADPTKRDRQGMLALGLAKGREVEAMLKAAPYQVYCLNKLRCVVGMMVEGREEGGVGAEEERQKGGNGEKYGREKERDSNELVSSSRSQFALPLTKTDCQHLTAVEEVRHAIGRVRQAIEPPRPMPRAEFHHMTDTGSEGEEQDGSDEKAPAPAVPVADLAARVLEEATRRMNGDLFFELLGMLWSWSYK
ncbi:hypothetical protein VYU27_004757 [Nannochloropsis oceanica]